ncbi:unnamed protein product [Angiostrongylus costaricensis]|uniref:Lysophospholipid acyltransferase 7 n=1 Tax=Angiostrongylus costaricensis TaxID=334426 RepID=A0A0R3Q0Y2_ANGCS|nr:unnamed protein product [Angiostrongylus costaricensis]
MVDISNFLHFFRLLDCSAVLALYFLCRGTRLSDQCRSTHHNTSSNHSFFKVIGLSFEVSDSFYGRAQQGSITRQKRLLEAKPNILDGLRSDCVWEMTFLQRVIYAAAVFVVFRARVYSLLYSAWAVAEIICVTLGLGIYPADSEPRIVVGPTNLEKYRELKGRSDVTYSSEAVVNLDISEIEFSDGFRSGIRSWNKSVQSWLALYVYSRTNRLYRVELTMFVSALWHGTYGGYFMSFLVVPMCTSVEDIIFKHVPVNPITNQRPTWFRYLYILTFRCRGFDMLATGFLLKNFKDTHRFWSSLYYWLLVVTLPIYILDKLYILKESLGKSTRKKDL